MPRRVRLTALVAVLRCGCVSTVIIDVDERSSFSELELSMPASDDRRTRLGLGGARIEGEDSQLLEFDERIKA